MIHKSAVALTIVFGLAFNHVSHAEVIEFNRAGPTCDQQFRACTLVVQIRGEITNATVDQLNRLIEKTRHQAKADNSYFSFMLAELDSRGGSVDAAMAIGRIIRKEEAAAIVNQGAVCLSSCILILAGGSYRSFDGKVGIHRPYLPVPSGDVSSQDVKAIYEKLLVSLRAYFREMNVVDGLADAMLRINPENIRLLTEGELANYGLTVVDPIAQETYDLRVAKKFGLNRQEYMRRKAIAESRCGGPATIGRDCYRNILKDGREMPSIDFSQFGLTARQIEERDDSTCKARGASPGTSDYNECRLRLRSR